MIDPLQSTGSAAANEIQSLVLKRSINLKVVVTPRWKEEVQQQLQKQIDQLDNQLQQLDSQGESAIAQLQSQSANLPQEQLQKQIASISAQVNQKKAQAMEKKNQALGQIQQIQLLEIGQEVNQGQLDSFVRVEPGDNLVQKMSVEILLRDGIVEEIRGEV